MNSTIYLRKISHNYIAVVVVVSFRPPFPAKFFCLFVSFERKIHRTISPTTLGHWICQNTLTTVFNMSRITFKVLTFRVIVKDRGSLQGLASNSEEAMTKEMEFIHLRRR